MVFKIYVYVEVIYVFLLEICKCFVFIVCCRILRFVWFFLVRIIVVIIVISGELVLFSFCGNDIINYNIVNIFIVIIYEIGNFYSDIKWDLFLVLLCDFVFVYLEVRLLFVNVINRYVGIIGVYEISRERGYLCYIVYCNV